MNPPKLFVAVKALITHQGKILLIRESQKYKEGTQLGKFDVVGGRIEPGHAFDESLLREIKEETGLDVKIGKPFFINEVRPLVKGEQWQIIRIFFNCQTDSSEVTLSEDHDAYKWIEPKDYQHHNVIENLYPVFEAHLNPHET
ncbi:NUDIX domain-containing protein [Candidatus Pacearchaeota archaeon]|nr:NUDIX domain-containing protein [Candidatus Pacearchaeota archaeon]